MICLSLEFIKVIWNLGKKFLMKRVHTYCMTMHKKLYMYCIPCSTFFFFQILVSFLTIELPTCKCNESSGGFFFSLYKKYKDEFQYWCLFCIYYILDNGIRIITRSVLHAGYWSVFWIITEFHLIKIMAAL